MKKILLFIGMFMFIFNIKALTFNVDLTNIEDKGNNGTMGSISNINVTNKTLDVSFSDVGDEVSFDLTITNSGDRAGTLKNINVTSTNDKIEYTHNLPSNGLAINGNDTNTVTITAKVKEGATNGTSTSTIKITYNYDEGSCPEGEILSEDESMCLCPTGKVRNEQGICIDPPKDVTCEEDEIYNETKKICEKKVVPTPDPEPDEPTPEPEKEDEPIPEVVTPINPKTMDNVVLISLLFIISGFGIYALMYKKLKSNRSKVIAGVITGVVTLGLSFTVLAGAFGIDNLFGAIVNPITKKQELVVTVNEEIEKIETWDGYCSANSYAPEDVFEGGSGTEEDPYTIKTANQLACFALSVNAGNSYTGQFVKQIKDIKLNNDLVETAKTGETSGLNIWLPIGDSYGGRPFAGTYDGNNHLISGTYLTAAKLNKQAAKGLFGYTSNATVKNLVLTDTFINIISSWPEAAGALIGSADYSLTVKNVTTYGEVGIENNTTLYVPDTYSAGIIGKYDGKNTAGSKLLLEDDTNNIDPVPNGIIDSMFNIPTETEEPNVIIRNVTNNGSFSCSGILSSGSLGSTYQGYFLLDNVVNTGNKNAYSAWCDGGNGIGISLIAQKVEIKNSHNEGNVSRPKSSSGYSGLFRALHATDSIVIDNCYNSGNISVNFEESYLEGVTPQDFKKTDSPMLAGLVGQIKVDSDTPVLIKDSFNSGTLSGCTVIGGLVVNSINGDNSISNKLIIENSYNTGNINVCNGTAGGLVARTKGTIRESYNSGNITVWGFKDPYDVLNSNEFHPGSAIGGLVGQATATVWTTDTTGATIIDSYNEGNIIVTAKTNEVTVGGICGFCGDITGSSNSGNITSKYATQYFNGIGFRTGTLTNTEFTGTITTENLSY